jgi:hypothetical protein
MDLKQKYNSIKNQNYLTKDVQDFSNNTGNIFERNLQVSKYSLVSLNDRDYDLRNVLVGDFVVCKHHKMYLYKPGLWWYQDNAVNMRCMKLLQA